MSVNEIANEILDLLGNSHTKVKTSNKYNSNYYNFLTDTIYLKTNTNNENQVKGLENANPFCGNLVTICHECIHSIQRRNIHILNIALSNLSVILAVAALVLRMATIKPLWFVIPSIIIITGAISIRLVLEIQAILKSIVLANKVIQKINIEYVLSEDIEKAKHIINKLLPLQIVRMVFDKIIMLLIVVI